MVYLGHVDTVVADPAEWTHDPWSGDVADGFLWGRGSLDMKSQVAAEAVAAATLARAGWSGAGTLKLVFVADEETGGDYGAQWLTETHPDTVRCDLLINEGAGSHFTIGGARHYGVCCAEKGIYRFTLTARGVAGHASLPRTGDNALVKLGSILTRLGSGAQPGYDLTEGPAALLAGLGLDAGDPAAALSRLASEAPELLVLVEPMLGVTLAPTVIHASDAINVIPSRATLTVDCRVPPGLGEDVARARIEEVLGADADGLELEFFERITGNASPVNTPLMSAISRWVATADPGAGTVPVILPGFSDSRWFREAFPDCVAYGFFPQRHQSLLDEAKLVHNADERIDVRDLGFAATCYVDLARELLS